MKIFNISTIPGKEKEIDIETAVKKYIEYCVVPQKKKDEDGNEIDLTDAEKGHYRKCFEEAEDSLKQICKMLETGSCDSVVEYYEIFAKLYDEDKENRRYIKKALVEKFSINMARKWRCEAVDDVYNGIKKIEEIIPVGDNSYLSFDAFSSLYGWCSGNEKNGKTWYSPLSNETIINTLKVFINHEDKDRLIKWIIEILAYDKKNYRMDEYARSFDPERLVLQKNLSLMMKEDEKIRNILINELLEGSLLFDLAVKSKVALKVKELENTVKKQSEEFETEKEEREKSYRERADKQKQLIDERDERIAKLLNELKRFERLEDLYSRAGKELTKAKEDLALQRQINEDIKRSDMEQLHEKEEVIEELKKELMLTKAELLETKESLDAIRVDITLKNNEISKLKESVGSKDSDATENLLKGLVSNLDNQIFYLSMFYQILSEDNGMLDEMNLGMFRDVLEQIDYALAEIGLKKIGVLDEIIDYDSAIHNPVSEAISNGEKVKVTGFGWEINGEIFIKIPVEREVE